MNYNYLNIFYTVAKLGNISKAAEELNVSQPAVSRIISNLEKEYRITLFIRSKTGVSLTKEGKAFYEMISNPFNELEKVWEDLSQDRPLEEITIHVGATSTALYCYLFKYLDLMKERFPGVNFRIYTGSSKKLLEMVDKGSIDFAFITTPFVGGENLELKNIYRLNNIIVAPKAYKDELAKSVSIKELAKYPFVLLSKEMQFREFVEEFLKKYDVSITPSYEADNSAVLIPLVENNCGLTFVPEEMAEHSIKEGKCFKVNLIEEIPPRFVTFVIKKDKRYPSVIEDIKKTIL